MKSNSNESTKSNREENRKKVVSSMRRDTKKALKYWTQEKMENAKPIPLLRKKTS